MKSNFFLLDSTLNQINQNSNLAVPAVSGVFENIFQALEDARNNVAGSSLGLSNVAGAVLNVSTQIVAGNEDDHYEGFLIQ